MSQPFTLLPKWHDKQSKVTSSITHELLPILCASWSSKSKYCCQILLRRIVRIFNFCSCWVWIFSRLNFPNYILRGNAFTFRTISRNDNIIQKYFFPFRKPECLWMSTSSPHQKLPMFRVSLRSLLKRIITFIKVQRMHIEAISWHTIPINLKIFSMSMSWICKQFQSLLASQCLHE